MGQVTTILLGAIAGFTIFLGLPVARLRKLPKTTQGFLNAMATGILIFLLLDVLSKANEPVEEALTAVHSGEFAGFVSMVAVFAMGLTVGLLSLAYFNERFGGVLRKMGGNSAGSLGADVATQSATLPTGRTLALMIAAGLGLHNFSEGLAIGQASVTGAISFAAVLIIGFGLHNVTEGFGIAAPMAGDATRPSWKFLSLVGLMGGGPTFLGTIVGYSVTSTHVFILFLTLAAGALIYIINEMFQVSRRMISPVTVGWAIVLGFLAGYGTDLILTFAGG